VVHAVEALDRDLLAVLHGGMEQALDDDAFNALALRLFAYQYDANIPYHKYCQRRGQTPETVQHWQQIPAVPRSGRACRRAPDRSRLCPGRNPAHELGRLLKRVFDIDVEHCPNCGGALKIIACPEPRRRAAIDDPPVIVKILSHLGLPTRAPPRAPARRVDLFQTI
jgi:hypothetical protein